ncbi:MAG: calcium/sodium antiporter [Anaerocolumna sp.]
MYQILINNNLIIILLVLGISLIILSKSADIFVDNAVKLSELLGLSEIVIGATIVSLGTTLPELSTSIISALQGNGGFGIGNAVGSVITNTSLILGIGALFGNIKVDNKTSHKISILIAAALVLIISTIPYKIGHENGLIPQWMGFIFIFSIPVYVYYLINQEKKNKLVHIMEYSDKKSNIKRIIIIIFFIIVSALAIAFSASGLVASAEILAERIGIPDVIISSTLVAFGTSVPELSTCITASKNKHGELAIGNIIGANILNILFVIGASTALTKGGLFVQKEFYQIHFIGLIVILAVFGFFAYNKKINEISKREGILLILFYTAYLAVNLVCAK